MTEPRRTFLLTGVTGFLGKVILTELIRRKEELGIERVVHLPSKHLLAFSWHGATLPRCEIADRSSQRSSGTPLRDGAPADLDRTQVSCCASPMRSFSGPRM